MFGLLLRLLRVVLVPLLLLSFARTFLGDVLRMSGERRSGEGDGRRRARRETGSFGGAYRSEPGPSSAYDVLGVSPGASDDEVRAKYRELISKYHPDAFARLNDPDFSRLAAEKFQRIQAAYEEIRRRRGM